MLLQTFSGTEISPVETLSELIATQERALLAADEATRSLRTQLSALAVHAAGPAEAAATDVEEITDAVRVRALLDSVATMARQQIRVIQPSAVARRLIAEWPVGDAYEPGGGVGVRTIHQSSLLRSEQAACYLERLSRRGVHVRVAPLLPFRLILVDEAFALVCPPSTTLLIRRPALLQLLGRVFEFCWDDARELHTPPAPAARRETAVPVVGSGGQDIVLSEQETVILRLWAKGRQDAEVARELRVSPRTLRRMVSALLRRLGVNSRFEAGVVAARSPRLLEQAGHPPLPA